MSDHTTQQIPPRTDLTSEWHAPPPVPPPARPDRREHRNLFGLLALLGALALAVGTIFAVTTDLGGPRVIIDERFDDPDEVGFSTDVDRLVALTVEDGQYRIELKDTSAPEILRHFTVRSFDAVRFEATVTQVSGTGSMFALGCWNGQVSYFFAVTQDGWGSIGETIDESTGERRVLTEMVPIEQMSGQADRLRLDCVGAGTGPTLLSGYVNGRPVLSVTVDEGLASFQAIGFMVVAEEVGTTFAVDDVHAVVERPPAPFEPTHAPG